MSIVGVLGIIIGIFRPFNKNNTYPLGLFYRSLSPLLMWVDVEVRNRDIATKNHPCVFIANHQSNLDVMAAAFFCFPGMVSLGKRQILFFPFFGLFYWLSGHILIDRSNRKKAIASMDKVKRAIQEKETSVIIMPEGTRSKGRGLLRFKKGAFHTALHAEVPIVPIVISDLEKGFDMTKFKKGKIIIEFLEPIETGNYSKDNVGELSDKAREIMVKELERINSEL